MAGGSASCLEGAAAAVGVRGVARVACDGAKRPARAAACCADAAAWAEGCSVRVARVCGTEDGAPVLLETHELPPAHASAVTALCVAQEREGDLVLVSASSDRVLTWAPRGDGEGWEGTEVCSPDAPVEALALDGRNERLAVVTAGDALVVQLVSGEAQFRLEAHAGRAVAAAFCTPHAPDVLATAGEDRTFVLWGLGEGRVVYRSCVLGASPLRSLAVDPAQPRLAVGADNGVVHFFDISALPACRQLRCIDIARVAAPVAAEVAAVEAASAVGGGDAAPPRVISAAPAWQAPSAAAQLQLDQDAATVEAAEEAAEAARGASWAVLALGYIATDGGDNDVSGGGRDGRAHDALDLLEEEAIASALGVSRAGALAMPRPPMLAVATSRALTLLNAHTYEARAVVPFRTRRRAPGGPESESPDAPGVLHAETARCAAFGGGVCLLASAFSPELTFASIGSRGAVVDAVGGADGAETESLSIFPSVELPEGSPLRASAAAGGRDGPHNSPASNNGGARKPKGSSAVQNKALTFRTRIRSSGYGAELPWSERKKKAAAAAGCKSRGGAGRGLPKQYPLASEPPVHFQAKHALPGNAPVHRAGILRLAFSGDGSRLATASVDKTARCLRLPISRHAGDGTDFLGHNAAVVDARWSHCGSMVLTCSADRTARLWQAARSDPLLELRCAEGGRLGGVAGTGVHTPHSATAAEFLHDVRAAQFVQNDRLILLASGAKLFLYRYDLGSAAVEAATQQHDDIARLKAKVNARYRLVHEYAVNAQSATDVACANGLASHLAIAVCSNRALEVHDLGACRVVRTVADAHARAPHCVRLNLPTRYASHARDAYELFATAAADATVKLWDMRARGCVRCFAGHAGARGGGGGGVAFSPCMRYLAAAGEDKAATLYDLRTGGVLSKLRGTHTDAVTDVAFSPVHPQVATACLDGRVRLFADAC